MKISTGKRLKSRREKIGKSDFTPHPSEKFPCYAPGLGATPRVTCFGVSLCKTSSDISMLGLIVHSPYLKALKLKQDIIMLFFKTITHNTSETLASSCKNSFKTWLYVVLKNKDISLFCFGYAVPRTQHSSTAGVIPLQVECTSSKKQNLSLKHKHKLYLQYLKLNFFPFI